MGDFNHNSGTYTLLKRTLHREGEGGFEIWQFEIEGKKYIFYSDIRYLYEIDERVLFVDLFSEESLNFYNIFTPTGTVNYNVSKVFGCINKLATQILPPLRKYRYVAFTGKLQIKNIIKKVIAKYNAQVNTEVIEATKKRLNYNLGIEVDAGSYFCEVGDLMSNPDFIAAGLDKKENRQEVNLEPVSLID
jgi:hypothetical protein